MRPGSEQATRDAARRQGGGAEQSEAVAFLICINGARDRCPLRFRMGPERNHPGRASSNSRFDREALMSGRILLATDGSVASDRAAQYVVRLAQRMPVGAVVLVNAQPVVHSGWVRQFLSQAQIDTALTAWGKEILSAARSRLAMEGIPVFEQIEIGRPGEAIHAMAVAEKCDEIVMGARGMGAIGNLALGSVAADVVERAAVPVTLLREASVPERLYRKVLIPLDGSAAAGRAADFLSRRAQAIGGFDVVALNVQEPVDHWHRAAAEVDAALRHRRDHGQALCRSACEVLARVEGKVEFEVRFGDPATVISETASRQGCDLIVMGTRGLGALGGLILGSVAFKVLHAAEVPITLIK